MSADSLLNDAGEEALKAERKWGPNQLAPQPVLLAHMHAQEQSSQAADEGAAAGEGGLAKRLRGRRGEQNSRAPGYRSPSRIETTPMTVHVPKDKAGQFKNLARIRGSSAHKLMLDFVMDTVKGCDQAGGALETEKQQRSLRNELERRAGKA